MQKSLIFFVRKVRIFSKEDSWVFGTVIICLNSLMTSIREKYEIDLTTISHSNTKQCLKISLEIFNLFQRYAGRDFNL
jgi:hypothetical protein